MKNMVSVLLLGILEFDIFIATRNRQQALETSLPLMPAQNCLPNRLITVDAGDDHSETEKVLHAVVGRNPAPGGGAAAPIGTGHNEAK